MSALATIGAVLDAAEADALDREDAPLLAAERDYCTAWSDFIGDAQTSYYHAIINNHPAPGRLQVGVAYGRWKNLEQHEHDLTLRTWHEPWPVIGVREWLDAVFGTQLAEVRFEGLRAMLLHRIGREAERRAASHDLFLKIKKQLGPDASLAAIKRGMRRAGAKRARTDRKQARVKT